MTFEARAGGSVFNTAIQLRRLGLPVSLISKTGADFLGDALLEIMHREKLPSKYIIRDNKIKTGLAFARIDNKGDSSYFFYRSTGKEIMFQKGEVPSSIFNNASLFHTASAYSYNDYTFEDAINLMRKAKEKGLFTTYDPNWRINRIKDKKNARSHIKRLLYYTDLLKLSETDAIGITGSKTLQSALSRLKGPLIVTLGERGAFFWDGKKKSFHPAFKVPVKDTIGAGDAFTAGLICEYLKKGKQSFLEDLGRGLESSSLTFASAVAALVCRGRGATEGLHSKQQVTLFLRRKHSFLHLS